MSKYYKPTTQKITFICYRKYIVPTEVLVDEDDEPILGSFVRILEKDIYNCCTKIINQRHWGAHNANYDIRSTVLKRNNHHLVNSGEAYWTNNNTICKGYELPNNIFRPIFQIDREKKAYKIRNDIVKFAKILTAQSRHYLYKKVLMDIKNLKNLPEDVINEILRWSWDINLLL